MQDKGGVKGVLSLARIQLMSSVLIAFGLLMSYGTKEALSALLGGLVALIPSLLFARFLFRYQGARAARQIVKSFYIGEALKVLSSVGLFTMVFVLMDVVPVAFFFTYMLVLLSHWFSPLIFANK